MSAFKPLKSKIPRLPNCLEEEQKKDDLAKEVLKKLGYELLGSQLKNGDRIVGSFEGFDENDFPRVKLFKKPRVTKPTIERPHNPTIGVVDMSECYILFPNGPVNPKWIKMWNYGDFIEY